VNYSREYLVGIDLFNSGQFWHAHEEWETAWMATDNPQIRLFYKGIIQTAAALVHWQRGNGRGLHLNWQKARAKLVQLPPHLMGLDLQHLISFMDHFEQTEGIEQTPPQLVLQAHESAR